MSRYVMLLNHDPELFGSVRRALAADVRFVDAGDTLHCDGQSAPLTNIYPIDNTPDEWEGWPAESEMRDPASMTMLVFECRSPTWVAEVAELLAAKLPTSLWIVDSADALWAASDVDPDRIQLG